ncbi:MAG: heat-inducible transcriptional repressor HrcA [Simkaniaceae bacterium]|nr:heat-inducible transcriptional repressor HrcA [Simkaniaceae bacterium]
MSRKKDRQQKVLLGLVELFIETGRPIGSNTLKEHGFESLSSATIRNYFAQLEADGFLHQQHTSGGRIPTDHAFKLYALNHEKADHISSADDLFFDSLLKKETKELGIYLQQGLEALSEVTGCAAFLTSPRFDQDFVVDVKLLHVGGARVLCAVITDFGMVHTELLYTPKKLSKFSLQRIEEYFRFRITQRDRPKLSNDESVIATQWYEEVILRYIVSYTNYSHEDYVKSGFHKLLKQPEFHDPAVLAKSLSLFEETQKIQPLLAECFKLGEMKFWVGSDLETFIGDACSVIAIPYKIQSKVVGTIALLGPTRMNYGKLFGQLKAFANYLSENLTKNIYTHKISYRVEQGRVAPAGKSHHLLIENQGESS